MNKNKPHKPPKEEEPQNKIDNRTFWLFFLGTFFPWMAFIIWLGTIFPVLGDNEEVEFPIVMIGLSFVVPALLLAKRRYRGANTVV